MALSDIEWPFHASRAIFAVAELLVQLLHVYTRTDSAENNTLLRRFAGAHDSDDKDVCYTSKHDGPL